MIDVNHKLSPRHAGGRGAPAAAVRREVPAAGAEERCLPHRASGTMARNPVSRNRPMTLLRPCALLALATGALFSGRLFADSTDPVLATDPNQIARYHDADAALPPPAPGENRVVFMGDSITDA